MKWNSSFNRAWNVTTKKVVSICKKRTKKTIKNIIILASYSLAFSFPPKKARYHSQKSFWFILKFIYNTEKSTKTKSRRKGSLHLIFLPLHYRKDTLA